MVNSFWDNILLRWFLENVLRREERRKVSFGPFMYILLRYASCSLLREKKRKRLQTSRQSLREKSCLNVFKRKLFCILKLLSMPSPSLFLLITIHKTQTSLLIFCFLQKTNHKGKLSYTMKMRAQIVVTHRFYFQ